MKKVLNGTSREGLYVDDLNVSLETSCITRLSHISSNFLLFLSYSVTNLHCTKTVCNKLMHHMFSLITFKIETFLFSLISKKKKEAETFAFFIIFQYFLLISYKQMRTFHEIHRAMRGKVCEF